MLMASNQSLQRSDSSTCWAPMEYPRKLPQRRQSDRFPPPFDDAHDLSGSLGFESAESSIDIFPEIDFFESVIDSEATDDFFISSDNYFESYPSQHDTPASAVVSSGPVQEWPAFQSHSYNPVNSEFQYQSNDWMTYSTPAPQQTWCESEPPQTNRKRQRNDSADRSVKRSYPPVFTSGDHFVDRQSPPTAVTSRPYLPTPSIPPLSRSQNPSRDESISPAPATSWAAATAAASAAASPVVPTSKSLAVGSTPVPEAPTTTATATTDESPPVSPWKFLLNAMRSAAASPTSSANSMLPMALATFSPGAGPGPYGELMNSLLTQLNVVAVNAATNLGASTANRTTMAALAARFAMAQYAAKQQKEAKGKGAEDEQPLHINVVSP